MVDFNTFVAVVLKILIQKFNLKEEILKELDNVKIKYPNPSESSTLVDYALDDKD
jgi:hypothetical protein